MSNDAAVAEPNLNVESYRLPRSVVPSHYEITLEPDLEKFTFAGHEHITVKVIKPVKEIVLNSIELTVDKAHVVSDDGKTIDGKTSLDEVNERLTISLVSEIQPGTYKIYIKFAGILNNKLHGFYRSTYKDKNGQEQILATTQFEATDARRAFPCFDEPDLKATFGITLIVDKNHTAISNAKLKSEKIEGDKKEVVFEPTVKMSTYLVAFVIGDLEGSKEHVVDNIPIRIWAVPGKMHLSHFGLDIAKSALSYFARYYGIPYPGTKLDLIAIPDFAFGAMENLGAVTFRETALLVDETKASHAELERIADVVAHELAHMWFGDLVTMKWWNGLWLNEAFATFMEILAVDNWKPNWKRWDTFSVSRAQAFAVDGLQSTRTIEFPVRLPEEAQGMFDVLTYEKGASVLRMLEQYLGAETFRKGVSLYLSNNKFANAETTDLWDAIEEASKHPVRKMMDSWIFQEGHPLVTVSSDESGTGIYLDQERFLFLADSKLKETLFHVPVMYKAVTDKGTVSDKALLTQKRIQVKLPGKLKWIVINVGGHGFYRVSYSPQLRQRLISDGLKDLESIDRFNLVNNTWAGVLAGHTSLPEYLDLLLALTKETDKNVLETIVGSLSFINAMIDPSEKPKLQAFIQKLLGDAKKHFGWQPGKSENELYREARSIVFGALGTIGADEETRKEAKELYTKYQVDPSCIEANMVPAIIRIVACCGDEKLYDEFFKEFKAAQTPQSENRYLTALAAFSDPKLLERTLNSTINGDIRTNVAPMIVAAVMANTKGRELAWKFMQEKWQTMEEVFPAGLLSRMCNGVTNLIDAKLEKEVIQFFATHKVKEAGKLIDQYLERLHVSVQLKEKEEAKLAAYW